MFAFFNSPDHIGRAFLPHTFQLNHLCKRQLVQVGDVPDQLPADKLFEQRRSE